MSGAASAVTASVNAFQAAFATIYALGIPNINYPPTATVTNESRFDMIIVGAGTAGCVLANRLSENSSNMSVLLIEAGGYAPVESTLPGLFTLQTKTSYDWNYSTLNDGYAAQNLEVKAPQITAGKMVGGSSSLHHMVVYQGAPSDFAPWAAAVDDSSWNYTNLQKYIKKSEKMEDKTILHSPYSCYHGVSGNMRLTRQPNDANTGFLKAMAEIGYKVRVDISGPEINGVCEPIFNIADGYRQGTAEEYLTPVKDSTNLSLLTYSTVTKILFDSNNVATGVEYVDSSGVSYVVYANKEVIISAGVIGSPYILQNSGIGPKSDLEAANIPVRADLPVGENLQDHLGTLFAVTLNYTTTASATVDPGLFPAPAITAYKDYDEDGSPDYQTIGLVFPENSSGFMQVCLNVFKYNAEVCETIYDASDNKTLFLAIPNKSHTLSKGKVYLNSTQPTAAPEIYHGMLSNSTDLTTMALYLQEFSAIVNTPTMKANGAEIIDFGFCDDITFNTTEYWECHARETSSAMCHLVGTCSMGTVLNNCLQVHGFPNLRVIDASSINSLISGFAHSAVITLAEKGADLIKEKWCMY